MQKHGAQLSIAIVCIVLGLLISMQFRTAQDYYSGARVERAEDLSLKLNTVTQERDVLAQEVVSLREKLGNVPSGSPDVSGLQQELKKAQMIAGLAPVQGPGVVVTLDDSLRSPKAGENPNNLLVHDTDILMVVNELKASGAEAIDVNGERVIAMSEIRCAGTTILVNSNKIGAPFIITAIGDPDKLESGLTLKGGYMESIKLYGLQSQIKKADSLLVPAYTGMFKFVEGSMAESQEGVE